jgi:hypothetical protein
MFRRRGTCGTGFLRGLVGVSSPWVLLIFARSAGPSLLGHFGLFEQRVVLEDLRPPGCLHVLSRSAARSLLGHFDLCFFERFNVADWGPADCAHVLWRSDGTSRLGDFNIAVCNVAGRPTSPLTHKSP